MRSVRASVGCARLGAAVLLLGAVGCGVPPWPPPPEPDWEAIATVVNDVYRTQGFERPVLFLDTDEVCDSVSPSCIPPDGDIDPELKRALETELRVKVRPPSAACLTEPSVPALTPVLCETGEVGVSVSLGRFSVDDEGRLRVNVSAARSGLDGVGLEYTLESDGERWAIIDTVITWIA